MDEETKYHSALISYKNYAVSIQCYELAARLREIETKYFKVVRSYLGETNPFPFDNYIGFNKDRLLKDVRNAPLNIGSIEIKRDLKIKSLLGEDCFQKFLNNS